MGGGDGVRGYGLRYEVISKRDITTGFCNWTAQQRIQVSVCQDEQRKDARRGGVSGHSRTWFSNSCRDVVAGTFRGKERPYRSARSQVTSDVIGGGKRHMEGRSDRQDHSSVP